MGAGVKILQGKLGKLPGGGKAEGQEPKEGLRSVLGPRDGGRQPVLRGDWLRAERARSEA